MSDTLRPIAALTELRQRISPDSTDLPVLSVNGFRPDADKMVGDECVRCTATRSPSGGSDGEH